MRILLASFISQFPHTGGLWQYVSNLKQGLALMGHDVHLFAQTPDRSGYYMMNHRGQLSKELLLPAVRSKLKGCFGADSADMDSWMLRLEAERYAFELAAAYFGLEQYDVIHAQDAISARALQRVKPKHVPLALTLHGFFSGELLLNGLVRDRASTAWKYSIMQEYHGIRSSDLTLVPSRWLRDTLVHELQLPADRFTVIPNGMDLDGFQNRMEQLPAYPLHGSRKVIVCTARLTSEKGLVFLLDALARLKADRDGWICLIAGDGPLRAELEQYSLRLGLKDHVTFLGERSDIPAILKIADVFVLPSLQDNCPYAVMEALAAGVPAVVTDAGGLPEMIIHGRNGLISAAGHSRSLTLHLKKLLDDPKLCRLLSEEGKLWCASQWSLYRMLKNTSDAYRSLQTNHSVPGKERAHVANRPDEAAQQEKNRQDHQAPPLKQGENLQDCLFPDEGTEERENL